MSESVALETLKENAKFLFKNNSSIQSLFGLSDGQFFDASSSGVSSARQYAKENNLEVHTFDRGILNEGQLEEPAKGEPAAAVKLDKLKLAELQSMATEAGILYEPNATKAQLIEAIEAKKAEDAANNQPE